MMKWLILLVVFISVLFLLWLLLLDQSTSSWNLFGNVSENLVRINQLDQAQYATAQEAQLWSPATCSTASMAEVLNAYGQHLRITNVLAVENTLHAITPQQGMLYPEAIAQTVAHFGFHDTFLTHPSLAQLIALANVGTPAIVNFPPAPGPWSAGHLLVLRGGDATKVFLADSSSFNLTAIPQQQFLSWWGGNADIVTPLPTQSTPPATLTNIYARQAWQIALQYHLPNPSYFVAQIQEESAFQPEAISSAGAVGIAQFLPATAACLDKVQGHCISIDPLNPEQAMQGAAYLMEKNWLMYLAQSPQNPLEAYRKALAAYNAGPETVHQAITHCGALWFGCVPQETQHYITVILAA